MPRVVPPAFKRDQIAKTGVRVVEARMLQNIADEEGCCPADVVYLAIVKLLQERFPETCKVERVGASSLLVR